MIYSQHDNADEYFSHEAEGPWEELLPQYCSYSKARLQYT